MVSLPHLSLEEIVTALKKKRVSQSSKINYQLQAIWRVGPRSILRYEEDTVWHKQQPEIHSHVGCKQWLDDARKSKIAALCECDGKMVVEVKNSSLRILLRILQCSHSRTCCFFTAFVAYLVCTSGKDIAKTGNGYWEMGNIEKEILVKKKYV